MRDADDLIREYYESSYSAMHSRGCMAEVNAVFHRRLERGLAARHFPMTVEVGVGNFEHLKYVTHSFDRYIGIDSRAAKPGEMGRGDRSTGVIEFVRADAHALPFADRSVDRIVATCLALHLDNPYVAFADWRRVLAARGRIDFLVPCDPGMAVRVLRRLVSERKADKIGVGRSTYRIVNVLEHRSSFLRVLRIAQEVFSSAGQLQVKYFPISFVPSWNLNAFAVLTLENTVG